MVLQEVLHWNLLQQTLETEEITRSARHVPHKYIMILLLPNNYAIKGTTVYPK